MGVSYFGAAPLERTWRFLGCDPGQGNLVAVAEMVRWGEGNRLGHGPRCSMGKDGKESQASKTRREGRELPTMTTR